MREILGRLFFGASLLTWVGMWCLYFHRRGYKRGYEAGRAAERQWLMDLEDGVEAEREKVWRDELP
jgi:hypothetical protein